LDHDPSPEEFARDVLVQLMRNAVEDLKVHGAETEAKTDDARDRVEVRTLQMLRKLLTSRSRSSTKYAA
jgi:hypothetical protein